MNTPPLHNQENRPPQKSMDELPQSASDLQRIYEERFSQNEDYRHQVWTDLTSRFFAQWIPPQSTVLDLGCGYCEFINNISAAQKFGMDLNPDAARNAAADVNVIQQDCSQPWTLEDASVDVIFTSNFFEHLPTKAHLERTLLNAHKALKREGRLIAMGPNIKYVPGEYWDFFDHHIALTEASLVELLKKCGFTMESVVPRFLPYTMANNKRYPRWTLRLYLRLRFAWPIFGKQFLVIATKR
jgi:SAM-dependent methyltransferase